MTLSEAFEKCLTANYTEKHGSANYAIERDGNRLYIFFEDSDGAEDWSINLDFPAAPYSRPDDAVWFAHKGFLEAWKRTEVLLTKIIRDPEIQSITIVGYSHGAAIALLCHEYAWYNRPELRGRIFGFGFGCPRVIWGLPRKKITQRWDDFTVIRNLDDIVTHLPPSALGYSHVGKLIEVGEVGKYSAIEAHYPQNILRELKKYEETE